MTPLSPTPLTPRTPIEQLKWAAFRIATAPPGECFMEADLDLTAAVASVERSLAERKLERDAAETRAVMWETGAKELQARVAERDARIAELEKDTTWQDHADYWQQRARAVEARNAALVRALKAARDHLLSPGARPETVAKEMVVARKIIDAALTEQQGGKHE